MAAALTLGLASKMKSLWDWAFASMIACRYFSSSLLRFPFTPTIGWLQRVTVAWLSGWIQDNTYARSARQYHQCPAATHVMVRIALVTKKGHPQVFSPSLGRQTPSSAPRPVCWQALPELRGRCHTAHSDHWLWLSSSFRWVYPTQTQPCEKRCSFFKPSSQFACLTCLLYSVTASYTFHPFSGNTWAYSKAKICCAERESETLAAGRRCSAIVTMWLSRSPAHWKQETQISLALRKWTSWVCPQSVCVQIADYAYPAEKQRKFQVRGSAYRFHCCEATMSYCQIWCVKIKWCPVFVNMITHLAN